MRSIVLAALVTTSVLAVGCGSSAPLGPSGVGGSSSAPTTLAPSANAPSSAASVPPAAASGPLPSGLAPSSALLGSHSDPALEAQLPSTVSGSSLAKFSLTLAEVLANGGDRTAIDAFLSSIGKTESDATFASAYDPTNKLGGGVSAYKVAGADAGSLLSGIVALQASDLGSGAVKTQSSVGGKTVTVVSIGTGVNDTQWVYGHGDVVFVVQAADAQTAALYLAALP